MTAQDGESVLFSEREIARRVAILAQTLASVRLGPEIAVPILAGAFVFAADLLRALSREGLDLPVEFVWLRTYGSSLDPGEVTVLKGSGDTVRGRRVLLLDGVCDSGTTLLAAKEMLEKAGAASILSAVAVTKAHARPAFRPDHSLFSAGEEFLFGYGMDRMGAGRALPDIRVLGRTG